MDNKTCLIEEDKQALREKIQQLTVEPHDLDDVIHQISADGYVDQLQLKRLKKKSCFSKIG
tara:strand:+ start:573 stop:755 length:183 start_codon:yes stop_codon:yes gene_type:complete